MALKWKMITVGPFAMNAYLLWCDETQRGILIDPGDEIERIALEVDREKVQLEYIVLTHAHLDHVWHAHEAQTKFDLKLYMHQDDLRLVQNLERQAAMLGFVSFAATPPRLDGYLNEGDEITFGKQRMLVRHAPGHAPGSIVLLSEKLAVVGDVLFCGSIGRTDLPGGSYETLMRSIREKLLTLADEVLVLPGHGEETTIGFERRNNPFLQQS
jgi:glyoxylase-like metal-dependent hydrolase (beta-lactamase superfamily II)